MSTLRNLTIGLVFGIVITFELLWTDAVAALAREDHRRNHPVAGRTP